MYKKYCMNYLTFIYRWSSRELRKIIVAILKSWLADDVKKINYVQNYSIKENGVVKSEEKILLVQANNQDELVDFLSKNFPQKIEKIYLV